MMRALQALTVHATPWQQLCACCIAARARLRHSYVTAAEADPQASSSTASNSNAGGSRDPRKPTVKRQHQAGSRPDHGPAQGTWIDGGSAAGRELHAGRQPSAGTGRGDSTRAAAESSNRQVSQGNARLQADSSMSSSWLSGYARGRSSDGGAGGSSKAGGRGQDYAKARQGHREPHKEPVSSWMDHSSSTSQDQVHNKESQSASGDPEDKLRTLGYGLQVYKHLLINGFGKGIIKGDNVFRMAQALMHVTQDLDEQNVRRGKCLEVHLTPRPEALSGPSDTLGSLVMSYRLSQGSLSPEVEGGVRVSGRSHQVNVATFVVAQLRDAPPGSGVKLVTTSPAACTIAIRALAWARARLRGMNQDTYCIFRRVSEGSSQRSQWQESQSAAANSQLAVTGGGSRAQDEGDHQEDEEVDDEAGRRWFHTYIYVTHSKPQPSAGDSEWAGGAEG